MQEEDIPSLPADTLAILALFQEEQKRKDEELLTDEGHVDEDWQLSQFWYSEDTANALVKEVIGALGSNGGKIAVISAPTLVQYFHKTLEFQSGQCSLKLFEYDDRFGLKFPNEFVLFDYRAPLAISEDLRGQFDIVVADPPFLSDECLVKTAQTVKLLSKEGAKIVFCTGGIMEEMIGRLLQCKRLKFSPQHANNLANDFGCFVNYDPVHLE